MRQLTASVDLVIPYGIILIITNYPSNGYQHNTISNIVNKKTSEIGGIVFSNSFKIPDNFVVSSFDCQSMH